MVKVHKLVAAIATTITLSTTSAYALELGDISWQSSYGQPLKAKIALKDTAGIKATDISSMLSNSIKLDNLPSLSFSPVILGDNSGYIEVKSSTPITEPFITFAIDVEYNGNTLTKEYNVLLDMPEKTTTASSTSKQATATTKTNPNTKATSATKSSSASSYRTSRGETLWSIAQKSYSSNVTSKAAKAIYDKNPKAFINGQHTQILADYTLTLPTMQEVNAISLADANAFINGKTTTPKAANNTAASATETKTAKVIQSKLQKSEQALSDARNENEQLSAQLENLQTEIDRLQAISEEKDTQITEIKTKLAQPKPKESPKEPAPVQQTGTAANTQQPNTQPATPKSNEPKPTTEPKSATPPVTPATGNAPKVTETPKPPVKTPPKPITAPKPVHKPAPIVDEPSFLSSLLGNQTIMMAGGGVLVLLCILALIIRRKKAMNDDAEEVDLSNVSLDDDTTTLAVQEKEPANTNDDPVSKLGEGMSVLDKVDVYLLYHHYDQAKALLKTALEDDPTNTEYYLKLLEILAEKGEHEAFDNESEHLLLIDPMAQHKINTLKTKYNLTTAKNQEQDSSVSNNDAHVTFGETKPNDTMLFDKNDPHPSTSNESDDFNFSFQQDTTKGQGLQKDADTFSFDEPILSNAEVKTDDNTDDFFSTKQPEVDLYSTENNDAFSPTKDEPLTQIDDFSFDIHPNTHTSTLVSDTEEQALTVTPVIETPKAAVEEETDDIIEKDQVTTKLELVNAYINMNDEEGAQDLLQEIIKEGNASQKAEAEKLLASLTGNPSTPSDSIASSSNVTPKPTAPLSDNTTLTELDLGFSLPPEDEVVTKLELAKAYIDMGDKLGAKDILEEVLSEGSEAQKQEALELIHSLN